MSAVICPVPDPLVAVERGLAVFPIPPGGAWPAVPGWAGGWQAGALRDPGRVSRLWRQGDNIGIGCWASGVVGLDLDVADGRHHTDVDGAHTLARLCDAHGQQWPDTLTVRTPSGGLHLYFRVPAGTVICSTSGGRSGLGPGIDTRGPGRGGRGGYLLGPTSVVAGRPYAITHDVVIAELPAWLTRLLELSPGRNTCGLAGDA